MLEVNDLLVSPRPAPPLQVIDLEQNVLVFGAPVASRCLPRAGALLVRRYIQRTRPTAAGDGC